MSKLIMLFTEMAKRQHETNININQSYLLNGNDWSLAVIGEVTEALESVGWSWHKAQTPDEVNLNLEIADIHLYGISYVQQKLFNEFEIDNVCSFEVITSLAAARMTEAYINACRDSSGDVDVAMKSDDKDQILYNGKELIASVATDECVENVLYAMFRFSISAGYPIEKIKRTFDAKSMLTTFRNNKGYKTGDYDKIWSIDGLEKEDNYFMMRLVDGISPEMKGLAFDETVLAGLHRLYSQRVL